MTETTPYAPPTTISDLTGQARQTTNRQLWAGYLIAPFVAPVLAAGVIFFGGLYLEDPDDMGTPIGIIVLPILMLTVGVVISYLLALVIGMPIAFALHRKDILTGSTIHLAAVIVVLVLALVFTLVGIFVDGHATLSESAITYGVTFLIITPFVVLPATVFWLIACRTSKSAG